MPASERAAQIRYTRTPLGGARIATTLRNASLLFVAKRSRVLSLDSIAKSLQEYGAGIAEYFVEYNRELKQQHTSTHGVQTSLSTTVSQSPASSSTAAAPATTTAAMVTSSLSQELNFGDLDVLLYDSDAIQPAAAASGAADEAEAAFERFLPAPGVQPRCACRFC